MSEDLARSPTRFDDLQIEQQKAIALRARLTGGTWPDVAQQLTNASPDGRPVDRETARRRYKSALTDFRVPRDEWETQRSKQLAELVAATAKVMTAIITWDPADGGEVSDLVGLTGALVRLQARADTVIGFPAEPPEPPPANNARDYVLNIVTHPGAHRALLASMREIERGIIDGEFDEQSEFA